MKCQLFFISLQKLNIYNMKKILFTLLFGLIGLVNCTKTEYVEEYFYNYDTIYVDNHSIDTLYVNKKSENICLANEIMETGTREWPYCGFLWGIDSTYIIESDKYVNHYKFCFIKSLGYYNYGREYKELDKLEVSESVKAMLANQNAYEDIVEYRSRDSINLYTLEQTWNGGSYKSWHVGRDSVIEIHCPHIENKHKWYFYAYYGKNNAYNDK